MSEFKSQHQLDLPWRFAKGRQGRKTGIAALAAKCGETESARSESRIRIPEIRMIEKIENIGADSNLAAFAEARYRQLTAQRDIHVVQSRSPKRIAPRISDPLGGR